MVASFYLANVASCLKVTDAYLQSRHAMIHLGLTFNVTYPKQRQVCRMTLRPDCGGGRKSQDSTSDIDISRALSAAYIKSTCANRYTLLFFCTTVYFHIHTTEMPKSKRARVVHLSKVEKKGKVLSTKLYANVREAADEHQYCFVFSVENMRNNQLQKIRTEFSDSRYVPIHLLSFLQANHHSDQT